MLRCRFVLTSDADSTLKIYWKICYSSPDLTLGACLTVFYSERRVLAPKSASIEKKSERFTRISLNFRADDDKK
jgi:hypothetical protein